jgi:hypothetical protein
MNGHGDSDGRVSYCVTVIVATGMVDNLRRAVIGR